VTRDRPTEPTDEDLLAGCRAGRADDWARLVERYQRLVYTVPRRAGLDEATAADVFQTCFARLLEHLDRIEDATRVRAWLVTTARRETLRQLERAGRRAFGSEVFDDADAPIPGFPAEVLVAAGPGPAEQLSQLEQLDRLRRAVDSLDERSRSFVELVFLQDEPLPYAELAKRLGIAEGSIGPTRARVLAKLRAALQRLDERPRAGP
jgi:RNA polymerase sigma factor (sigma-70 family)